LELWHKTASSCRVVRAGVFAMHQLCCPSAASLFGQLLQQQGGAIQFWMLPSALSSGIHHLPCFGWLACHPTPALSLCTSPDLCWVLVALLGGWIVSLLLLSAFAALPALVHWEFGFLPHLHSLGQVQHFTPNSLLVLGYSLLFMFFSFAWGRFSLTRGCVGLFSQGVGREVTCGAWCSPVCSAVSCKQLWSQLVGRNGSLFAV
jgi:hypothetical protein